MIDKVCKILENYIDGVYWVKFNESYIVLKLNALLGTQMNWSCVLWNLSIEILSADDQYTRVCASALFI